MKIRESGMPDEEIWESFFDPEFILRELGLNHDCRTVVDLGCGYGTFAIPAARMINGVVYALDIEQSFIAVCETRIKETGVNNVICQQRDFISRGTGLADNMADYVMLFNIMHAEHPLVILNEAVRILVPAGKIGVIHWNYDSTTPRGPDMDIRPRPEQCQEWVRAAGFELIRPLVNLPPYHYGMVGQKP
jgi:ubiquinone/menaquinone biosynthesis C-methylase UbiE